jgi:CTD small phosphatase-like protein 2
MEAPPLEEIKHLFVNLPPFNHSLKTKTIVFDLDETLIHSVDDVNTENPQLLIPIKFSDDPEPLIAGVNIRPYAKECLMEANQNFQVIVFTASEQEYADPIIDVLDPEGTLIQARYYRQHCVRANDCYIKDLRIFHERSLADIILVDNSVYSFAYQLDNGVPIVSYYHDEKDEEMLHLKFYLDCLTNCADVREKNREAFQLEQLAEA